MFQRAQRACVDFAVLPLVLFSVWGGPSLGQTQTTPSAQPADTGSLTVKLSFVFMGCNRIQHSDWKKIREHDPSSAILLVFHGRPRGQPRRRQRQDAEVPARSLD